MRIADWILIWGGADMLFQEEKKCYITRASWLLSAGKLIGALARLMRKESLPHRIASDWFWPFYDIDLASIAIKNLFLIHSSPIAWRVREDILSPPSRATDLIGIAALPFPGIRNRLAHETCPNFHCARVHRISRGTLTASIKFSAHHVLMDADQRQYVAIPVKSAFN